jgi:receptor protein-tyrosine kinase
MTPLVEGGFPPPPPVEPEGAGAAFPPPVLYQAAPDVGMPRPVVADLGELLGKAKQVPFRPNRDAHMIDPSNPQAPPGEEFRTLRTRLNHLQTLSPIKSLLVTSPSPAEGKSFAAVNLALTQSQLEGQRTVLCDFDFRRPVIHQRLGIPRSPGLTDYLLGQAELSDILYKVESLNLYLLPAGQSVINPLELLNLRECRNLIEYLPKFFNWAILDTPPILYAADASLLSTICHGSVLVVRLGHTNIDTVTRAMQSLCTNNVVGTIVNGARQGELYSRYRYYRYYYEPKKENEEAPPEAS